MISPEGRAKIVAAAAAGHYSHWKGRTHTPEARLKMSKAVEVSLPDGTVRRYDSITALRAAEGVAPAVVNNALKSGAPVSRGLCKGWCFRYAA